MRWNILERGRIFPVAVLDGHRWTHDLNRVAAFQRDSACFWLSIALLGEDRRRSPTRAMVVLWNRVLPFAWVALGRAWKPRKKFWPQRGGGADLNRTELEIRRKPLLLKDWRMFAENCLERFSGEGGETLRYFK